MRSLVRCIVSMIFAGLAGTAQAAVVCTTPLFGFGPIDPVHGFPQYYQDSTGLALQPCLDAVCGGAGFALPNPNLPLSFPDNFPVELFYSRAISKMTVGTMSALYVAALEGSFANGVRALPGDQVVFSRIRVRILGATPGGIYTITHPYGVEVLTADGLGTVNFTQDSPRLPVAVAGPAIAFGSAITGGRVGPFPQAVAPPPPPGLVGNPAANQTVTGSPCATNFVRFEGPGFPVGGMQTNVFGVVIGKIAHVCGNGVLDLGEQCDDGNLLAGDCCSPLCQFEPAGSPCTDGNPCTDNACDGAGTCLATPNMALCSDGNVCTTADVCTAGVCVGGPPLNCDDGNLCTTDLCTPPTVGCENLNNALACDDGNAATAGDTCSGGKCMGFIRDGKLSLVAGENPSLVGFTAVADARTDGTSVRVSLTNMDPRRFPAGCAGATINVGAIIGTATVTPFAAQEAPLVRATAINFLVPGTVPDRSAVSLEVTCTVGGIVHSTQWTGVVAAPCTPTTCAAQGKNCGTIPDGCGGTLTCGVCTAPQTCGGGGVANVCGVCIPTTCAAQGKNCGTIPDGCGGTLTCGVCTAPQTCGGGGVANVCGVAAPNTALLTLTATGRAGESVLSTPAGLNVPVGKTGSASFPVGTSITLSATNRRSVIWSGVCSSGGVKTPTCTFTLKAVSSETASVQ